MLRISWPTDYVKNEFSKEKVLLIGHSYGTYIGMKAANKAPEKDAAYIGIGQVLNYINSEVDSLNYRIKSSTSSKSKGCR